MSSLRLSSGSIYSRIVLFFLLTTATVFAQDAGFNVRTSIAFSLAPASEEVSAASVSPILGARYTFANGFHIDTEVGLAALRLIRSGYGTTNNVRIGNPMLSGGYHGKSIDGQEHYEVNLRIGIPLATFPGNIPDNRLVEFNYNNANCAYGWKDPYLWLMNSIPIVIDAQVAGTLTNKFTCEGNLSPSYVRSVNSRPSRFVFSATVEFDYNYSDIHLRAGSGADFQ